MRVLQICLKPPLPSIDGGCLAINAITQGLINNNVGVKLLTISTAKHPFIVEKLPKEYLNKTQIEHVFVDTKVKPIEAFCNLFSKESYNIKRFYNDEFKQLILKTLKNNKYDIVLLESLFVAPYVADIRNYSDAKIIYRAHNIEYEVWERNANQTKGLKKNYINLLAKRLKAYEVEAINQVDGIVAITEKDKTELINLECKVPIVVTPFGIDSTVYGAEYKTENNTVFHIGSMDWMPNQEGVKWFLSEVWDKVVQKNSNAQFNLAGKKMPSWLQNLQQQNVTVVGRVESAVDFMLANSILVVPLFSGSGMRIKIIEAMALGKLVIATGLALEGISCSHKKEAIIANTSDEFVEAITYYLANVDEQKQIALAGQQLVQSNYDNQVIVNNLVSFFKEQN
ncbi:MAG: glycosyltransferase family 4 protein [Vicingaceae bacterium]|nr:glycosyltransferase family 4 protein [Vicingaceae bacterium]